ncbi:hypothetical protein R6Q59_018434 [Mikania micrantha]
MPTAPVAIFQIGVTKQVGKTGQPKQARSTAPPPPPRSHHRWLSPSFETLYLNPNSRSSPAAFSTVSHHPRRQSPSADSHHPRAVTIRRQPPKINWKQEGVEKTFLEACIHELTVNGREGAWRKLKNKTCNIYNAVTNMFNLSEEEWQLEMKSNKFVEALRTVPLAYPELCTQLFEGSTCNDFESWGPFSTFPHPFEEVLDNTSNGLEDVDLTAMGTPTVSVNDDSPVQPKKKGVKRKDKESINSSLIEIKDNINEMAKVFIEKHKASNDIEACMAKLESMGWDVLDAKYQTAILLFGESADLRKVWLLLNPLACKPWVNNA